MKRFLYLLIAAFLLVGCRSSRHVAKDPVPGDGKKETVVITNKNGRVATEKEYISRMAENKVRKSCVTANVKVTLNLLGQDLSVNGSLRMKRDDVIRLSLRFFGFEVGLMEFTPNDILIVDRRHKQYVRAAYSEVGPLRQANLDFYALQALFWNELFVPGERDAAKQTERFRLSTEGNHCVLTLTDTPKLSYSFFTEPETAHLEKLQVKTAHSTSASAFNCTYARFVDFAGRQFPTDLRMDIRHGGKDFGLYLNLSSLGTDDGWNSRTTISSKYTRRSVDEILNGLKL